MSGRAPSLAGATASRRPPDRPALLRALRHHPALVDDVVAARLLASSEAAGLTAEELRWARAWLVCSQAAVTDEPSSAVGEGVSPAFDPRRVQPPKGLSEPARQAAVMRALVGAGVLRPASDASHAVPGRGFRRSVGPEPGSSAADALNRVCWTPAVCAVHSAAAEIDWPAVVVGCAREPAALLVVRTLAEYAIPAEAWAGVPRRDFMERTGYQQKQVRVALRRLVAAGLVEAEGENGRTARYRFTARALAPRWEQPGDVDPSRTSPPARVQHDGPPPGVHASGAASARPPSLAGIDSRPQEGIDVVLGGVTVRMAAGASLDVGPGASARIEIGVDGRLSLRVDPG